MYIYICIYLYIKHFINLSCGLESSQENRIIVIISEYVIMGILVGFLPLASCKVLIYYFTIIIYKTE